MSSWGRMIGSSKAVVERFLAAANDHDIDATVACLSEQFECRGWDGLRLNREQMRVWLGWEIVMSYAYELSGVKELGESLTAVMTEESELYRLLRMEPQRVRLRFEVRGDLIQVQEFEPLPSGTSLGDALKPFLDWADRERPSALDGWRQGAEPVVNRESAERWLSLLREWSASREPPTFSAG